MPSTTQTTSTQTATGPSAGRATTRRRRVRRLAATVALGLTAATLVGGVTAPAGAESPVPDEPQLPIAVPKPDLHLDLDLVQAPPGPNLGKVTAFSTDEGDSWIDGAFRANVDELSVQVSTTQPQWQGDVPSMGPVMPQYLVGTPTPGDIDAWTNGPTWDFSFSRDGLQPHTDHWVLVTVPGVGEQDDVYYVGQATTDRRFVRMTPTWVHVLDDADGFAKGAGEIQLGFRIAPEGDAFAPAPWWGWTGYHKLHSGEWLDLGPGAIGPVEETRADSIVVQAQGIEEDIGWGNCPLEGGPQSPQQHSDSCFDMAYATAATALPTHRYEGTETHYVWAEVGRDPALRFDVLVKVETWHG